ncbi:30S ribosomal protein S12 methylthiotransferase RimO [Fontivita pretiosa]|uniref:30S ribosomal protein S12 methylthiotransferase RimO n=1 Tax=Fontivita pretiosa TaxID=2989684 RepID=UPI003D16E1AB
MTRTAKPIRTVAFVSLGCPKNLVDSERMLGLLAEDGLIISSDPAQADAIVINTCGFLEASKIESMEQIQQAIALKKQGQCKRIIVAGCLVQRHKTELLAEAPEIDRLVGVFDREHIVQAVRGRQNPRQPHGHYLGKYHDLSRQQSQGRAASSKPTRATRLPVFEDDRGRLRLTPRHYAYLRISEGCNQGCTFCTIPSIRGPMRSKPLEHILAEARELAADGAVELNLIGQDTTSYGTDIGYAPGLSGLLRTLDRELADVRWLRLMYAYPSCFTDEMIAAIAECDRVVKYIDIPLQHINDQILAKMRRRVTRKQIETLLDKLRRRIPGLAIRTTFIAGSPGETDAQHQELVQFVKDFGFDMMGVFAYSQEPGTAMGRMPDQIPDDVKQRRVEELMLAQQQVAFARAAAMVGRTLEVLIDAPAPPSASTGAFVARSQSQAPEIDSVVYVRTDPSRRLHPGQFVNVKVAGHRAYDLIGDIPRKRSRSLTVVAG